MAAHPSPAPKHGGGPHGARGGGGHGGGHPEIEPYHEEEHHEEHEEGEAWLISYADLMTLLFGLFALMFSFAKFDDDKAVVKVDKALAKYFGQSVLSPSDVHSKPRPEDKPGERRDEKGQDPGNYSGLGEQMKVELDRAKSSKEATFKQAPDGYEINFVSSLLFTSGKADLMPGASDLIGKLGLMIKNTGIKYQIRVEGHTDDNPIRSGIFPSNWELSAARAATILRIFEAQGFESSRLMAIGYGSSRPAYPNRKPGGVAIPENQALNRRVIVKVIVPEEAPGSDGEKTKPAGDTVLNANEHGAGAELPAAGEGAKPEAAKPANAPPSAPTESTH